MKLKCVGCGEAFKVRFATWWFYFMQGDDEYGGPYFHEGCYQDMLDQRRLDGLD